MSFNHLKVRSQIQIGFGALIALLLLPAGFDTTADDRGGGTRLSADSALRLARIKTDALLEKPFETAEQLTSIGNLPGPPD